MLSLILLYASLNTTAIVAGTGEILPFDLDEPTLKIELSQELKEISGLTWYKGQLGAVQDEKGTLYLIDPESGTINRKINFSLPGDFEGIEAIGKIFYALTSSGSIYKFHIDRPEESERIVTPITWKNDTEGLAYLESTNQLLIACKEDGSVGTFKTDERAIYGLDLNSYTLSKFPVLTIAISDLQKYKEVDKFKPSALAIDPVSCNLYILSSVGKLLLVYNQKYELMKVKKLSGKKYRQPEGICFSSDGDLYISNEGSAKKNGNILLFKRR